MKKFIEVQYHFSGKQAICREIINIDEIARVEEYKKFIRYDDGQFKEHPECILVRKDDTQYILEDNFKEKIIKQLLEL